MRIKNSIAVSWFSAAYGEVVRITTDIEDDVAGAEVQQVLVVVSLVAVQKWLQGINWGDVFREVHLHILVNSKSRGGKQNDV